MRSASQVSPLKALGQGLVSIDSTVLHARTSAAVAVVEISSTTVVVVATAKEGVFVSTSNIFAASSDILCRALTIIGVKIFPLSV